MTKRPTTFDPTLRQVAETLRELHYQIENTGSGTQESRLHAAAYDQLLWLVVEFVTPEMARL